MMHPRRHHDPSTYSLFGRRPEEPEGTGLVEATRRAEHLAAAGDLAAAFTHLHAALVAGRHPVEDLVVAGVVYAYILARTGHPRPAIGWAGWAHTTSRRLHGDHDPRTVKALHGQAVVYQQAGDHHRSATTYRDLVDALAAVDGLKAARTLSARADLAVALHTIGACNQAQEELAEAFTIRRHRHGNADPLAVKMLTRLAGMHRDCSDSEQADVWYAHARNAEQELSSRVDAAARSPADPVHRLVCTRHRKTRQQSDPAPSWPPEVIPEPWQPPRR